MTLKMTSIIVDQNTLFMLYDVMRWLEDIQRAHPKHADLPELHSRVETLYTQVKLALGMGDV